MIDYNGLELEEIERLQAEEKKAYQKYMRESRKLDKLREALQNGEKVSFQDIMEQNNKMCDAMAAWVNYFPASGGLNHEKLPKEEKEPREPKAKRTTKKKTEMV